MNAQQGKSLAILVSGGPGRDGIGLVKAVVNETVGCLARAVKAQFDSSQTWRNFPDQVTEQLGRRIFLNQVPGLFDPSELRIREP
jgi:hypothetical protein